VRDAGRLAGVDELLELKRPPKQTIQVVDDHGVPLSGPEIGEHSPIFGALLSTPGGDVVVDIEAAHRPPLAVGQSSAVFFLAGYAEPFSSRIVRDPAVNGG
jgi:hypothetical protein